MSVEEKMKRYLSDCLDMRREQLARMDLTPKQKWRLKGMVEAYEDALSTWEFMELIREETENGSKKRS